ncbi:MAG: lactate racemase domain-containing protein [candidate division Zixibacteria bacterium]|nr:lactate racemase domain-containing protein [candidate division Zixibacteria bacterium]
MEVDIAYGGSTINLKIPSSVNTDIFAPAIADKPFGFEQFETEFRTAGGIKRLSGDTILIVVNDAYRNTPTSLILEWLDRIDNQILDRARFLISTGAHQPSTKEQLQDIFKQFYDRIKPRLSIHNARDNSTMLKLGVDNLNGNVLVNKAVADNETVIVIGSVEPHYFAGYTGGRKSIFPGLTDPATIERNHNLANSLEAAPLKLKGNPVAEHLDSLMGFLDSQKFFGIQIVLDADHKIAGLYCGRLDASFTKATQLARKFFSHRVKKHYDAVICELLPPLDSNLYQVQKALENCQGVVRDGGAVILVSACKEGIGSEHFFQQAKEWDRNRNRPIDGRLRFGSHKLSRVNAISMRIHVYLYSDLSDAIVCHVFYEPLDNVKKFLFLVCSEDSLSDLAIVNDAGNTVLTI